VVTRRDVCALCGETIGPGEPALDTPDFIADESDPLYRVADASVHRACFLVWETRKRFVARFNRVARGLVAEDGSYPHMTSEGDLVRRQGHAPPSLPSA
jgi:hypothetical protein